MMKTINGSTLYYEVSGKGTALVFLPECGLTHTMFKPQADYFRHLCEVVTVDLRGNGQSGKLTGSAEATLDTQCEDVSLLLGHLGIRQAVLIGSGYGGVVAQRLAFLHPEQVKGLILADSFSRSETRGKVLQAVVAASLLAEYLPGELSLRPLRILYGRYETAYRVLRQGVLERRAPELIKQKTAASRIDYSGLLQQIRVPALCLAGGLSDAGVRRMRDAASRLPGGRMELIAEAPELCNLCQPDGFNRSVERFLREQGLLVPCDSILTMQRETAAADG